MSKCQEIALQFLSEWFRPEETFALLVRYPEASRSLQRILRLSDLMVANYLGWLASENSRGANIYFSINPLRSGAKGRTKSQVESVKGLYLDLDSDGDRKLATLRGSKVVPPLAAVIRTSVGKYQVIWRVKGFRISEQEASLKALAETFGGDRACTDCARVFRLPGFFNRKYSPAFPVTVEMQAAQLEHSPGDFGSELTVSAGVQPHQIDRATRLGSRTKSESDWRWVMAQLNAGIPAHEIARTLANMRSDKPNPHYYAHRTVDIATAVQLVRKGIDFGSLIEDLKTRNSALSTDRAAEIARTAFSFVQRVRILQSKEN